MFDFSVTSQYSRLDMSALEMEGRVDILPQTVSQVSNPRRRRGELWKPETAYVAIDSQGNGWLLVKNVTTFDFRARSDPDKVLRAKVKKALKRAKNQFPQGDFAITPGV